LKLIVVAIAALAFAAPAFAGTTYNDATGENAAEADISTVTVSDSPSLQTVNLTVTVANMPTLETNAAVVIFFDTDRSTATGAPATGFDYAFGVGADGYTWEQWSGSDFADAPGDLAVVFDNGVLSVTIPTSALGNPTAFDFALVSIRGPDPNNPVPDQAPDGGRVWTYTMTAAPTTTTTATPPATPQAPTTVTSTTAVYQGVPTSGKAFVVKGLTVDLSTGVETKAKGVACTATLGGKALKGTGAGHCTFKLPKTAKGQRLSVHVTGTYGTTKLGRTYAFKVR
jgi:hypothetical protein